MEEYETRETIRQWMQEPSIDPNRAGIENERDQ